MPIFWLKRKIEILSKLPIYNKFCKPAVLDFTGIFPVEPLLLSYKIYNQLCKSLCIWHHSRMPAFRKHINSAIGNKLFHISVLLLHIFPAHGVLFASREKNWCFKCLQLLNKQRKIAFCAPDQRCCVQIYYCFPVLPLTPLIKLVCKGVPFGMFSLFQ